MFVRMKRMHDYIHGSGLKRRIPAGWTGALDDEIARKAIKGGIADEIEGDAAMTVGGHMDAQSLTASTVKPDGETATTDAMGRAARDPAARAPAPTPPPVSSEFAKFDHDGDGRPGGAVSRSSRREKKD